MTIAILGWGSLIWDPRELPHYGPWKTGGPMLPIEFSRVSSDGRLTLVVDSTGTPTVTRFALSPRTSFRDAVEDLRSREGTTRRNIGFVVAEPRSNSRAEFPHQVDVFGRIGEWCQDQQVDACVWTALLPNFRDELGLAFSVDHAVGYLSRLGKSTRENALRYFRNAPQELVTPLRTAVAERWPDTAG